MNIRFLPSVSFYGVLILIALPIVLIFFFSIHSQFNMHANFEGYCDVLQPYRIEEIVNIIIRSLLVSFCSTFIAFVISYILVSKANNQVQAVFLIITTVPFLTNEAIRIFSWQKILSSDGALNSIFHFVSLQKGDFSSARNFNVYWVMILTCLPVAIFVCTAFLKVIPTIFWKVSDDIKLSQFSKFIKIAIPMSKLGLISSFSIGYFIAFGLSSEVTFLGGATKISLRLFILSLMSANKFEAIFALGTLIVFFIITVYSLIIYLQKVRSYKNHMI